MRLWHTFFSIWSSFWEQNRQATELYRFLKKGRSVSLKNPMCKSFRVAYRGRLWILGMVVVSVASQVPNGYLLLTHQGGSWSSFPTFPFISAMFSLAITSYSIFSLRKTLQGTLDILFPGELERWQEVALIQKCKKTLNQALPSATASKGAKRL